MAVPLHATAVLPPGPTESTYAEYPPPAGHPAVVCTWEGEAGVARTLRVLPDGCADLAWDGARIQVAPPVAGPVRYPVTAAHAGVRLRPGWVGAALGGIGGLAPGTPLADVLPRSAVERAEAEMAEATRAGRRAALVRLVETHVARGARPDTRVLDAARRLAQGEASVAAAADGVGLGERQFRRLFEHHVGLSPKAFQAVTRFRRTLSRTRSGCRPRTLAQLAAECGYYDQSHLVRECRRLAGATPTALMLTAAAGRRRGG